MRILISVGVAGPMARLKAAASMWQQQQQQQSVQQAQQPKLYKHVPARLPPSHNAISDWLDAESAMCGPPASSSSSGAAAAQAAAGSGFVMDANTGRLVPLQASATQVAVSFKVCNVHAFKSDQCTCLQGRIRSELGIAAAVSCYFQVSLFWASTSVQCKAGRALLPHRSLSLLHVHTLLETPERQSICCFSPFHVQELPVSLHACIQLQLCRGVGRYSA